MSDDKRRSVYAIYQRMIDKSLKRRIFMLGVFIAPTETVLRSVVGSLRFAQENKFVECVSPSHVGHFWTRLDKLYRVVAAIACLNKSGQV